MVDNLLYQAEKLKSAETGAFETSPFKAAHPHYGVITLHRPSNVDDAGMMARIDGALREIAQHLPLIFPVHPRTRGNLEKFGVDLGPHVTLIGQQAYMAILNLWKDAVVVLTGTQPTRIIEKARKVLLGEGKQGRRPLLREGRAAERIVDILARELEK